MRYYGTPLTGKLGGLTYIHQYTAPCYNGIRCNGRLGITNDVALLPPTATKSPLIADAIRGGGRGHDRGGLQCPKVIVDQTPGRLP